MDKRILSKYNLNPVLILNDAVEAGDTSTNSRHQVQVFWQGLLARQREGNTARDRGRGPKGQGPGVRSQGPGVRSQGAKEPRTKGQEPGAKGPRGTRAERKRIIQSDTYLTP